MTVREPLEVDGSCSELRVVAADGGRSPSRTVHVEAKLSSDETGSSSGELCDCDSVTGFPGHVDVRRSSWDLFGVGFAAEGERREGTMQVRVTVRGVERVRKYRAGIYRSGGGVQHSE